MSRAIKFAALLLIILFNLSCSDREAAVQKVIKGFTMGTTYSIKWYSAEETNSTEIVKKDVTRLLDSINRKMSVFIKDSEISRFNRYEGNEWFDVSKETADLFKTALEIHEATDGAFDITIGPLIRLWGFGKDPMKKRVPSDDEIKELLKVTGSRFLEAKDGAIKKLIPSIYCNLSSIAKGYGVDAVGKLMEQKGIKSYLVEIGGETRVRGSKPGGKKWAIGIAEPTSERAGIQEVIEMNNMSMATSGDYHNYFEKDGVRFSHIIDPKTGYPIKHKLASVTVLHQSCMIADAWATALDVMGVKKGLVIAEKNNLAVYMIYRAEDSFKVVMTKKFKKYIGK